MPDNKTLLAGLVGGILVFFLGFLFYGLLLQGVFESNAGSATNVMKTEMAWWALILGNLVWGMALAYIMGHWAQISTAMGGLKAGALLGFFYAASYDFVSFGTSNLMNLTGTLIDVVVWTLISAIAGAVVGLMLGRGEK